MTVYKRRARSLLPGILAACLAGLLTYLIASRFTANGRAVRMFAVTLTVILLQAALFWGNTRFELEGPELRYFQKGRLRRTFLLADCLTRYHIRSRRGFPPKDVITLYLLDTRDESAREINIDCSSLGLRQFERLFAQMQQNTGYR